MLNGKEINDDAHGGKLGCEFCYVACLGWFLAGKSDSFSKISPIFKKCILFV